MGRILMRFRITTETGYTLEMLRTTLALVRSILSTRPEVVDSCMKKWVTGMAKDASEGRRSRRV